MKVYLTPPAHLSRAMFRVAKALSVVMPDFGLQRVLRLEDAELQVAHVIDWDAVTYDPGIPMIVVQYCTNALSDADMLRWQPLWARAKGVWSYYDLDRFMPPGATFLRSPLGIDPAFRGPVWEKDRTIGIMTSGYVSGPGAEAIEEVHVAAKRHALSTMHLGPLPTGMSHTPKPWTNVSGISDKTLAEFYGRTQRVSGLRHNEGFELPVIEGLACGCRPIVFDRPEMHFWYDDHAEFVKEQHGQPLIEDLYDLLSQPPRPVSSAERAEVIEKFDWEVIATHFWEQLL